MIQNSKLTSQKTQTEKEADYLAFKLNEKQINPIYEYTSQLYIKQLQVDKYIIHCYVL
ncbi:hypothetical protein ACU68U_09060 [Finegoldia sp. P3-F-LR]